MYFVATFLLGLIIILCIIWIRDRRYKQGLFKRLGIQGPEPSLFLGNIGEFESKGFKYELRKWTKQYGKLFGYYEGEDPVLVVSDPELVKQITIKEFHKFHSHKTSPFDQEDASTEDIFGAQGDKWKRLRSISSSSFTARRMKEMSPLINNSVTDLLTLFDKRCDEGKPFDIHGDFGRLTTDVISSCAFGIDTGCIRDDKSRFLQETKKIFDDFENLPLRLRIFFPLVFLFPGLIKTIRRYFKSFDQMLTVEPWWFLEVARKVLQERQSMKSDSKTERVDFVKLMLDANKELESGKNISHVQETDDQDPLEPISQTTKHHSSLKPLTLEEMQAQMALFMLAGYETTSTALGFTAYDLALHPEVQKKLQAEIDTAFPSKDIRPDYTTVHKLPYMEAVLKETLRFHPIAPIGTTRKCFEETKIGDVTIPKGMLVQLNMEDLHFNPEFWGQHDPKKFVPDRFLEDCQDAHNNMAWIPFGAGPRICLGMRFAQMEYKIALARLLKTFNIKKCDETKVPLPTKKNGVHGPSEGVYVILERRA